MQGDAAGLMGGWMGMSPVGMSLVGRAALAAVAVQLAATALFQFAPWRSRYYRLDYVGVLPRWRFFVPDKGSLDHAIAIRDRQADGSPGAWRTAWEMPARTRWSWLWAPDHDADADLWYAAATLDSRIARGRPATAETSPAYAAILAACRRRARAGAEGGAFQFALVRIDRAGGRQTGFVSPFHPW